MGKSKSGILLLLVSVSILALIAVACSTSTPATSTTTITSQATITTTATTSTTITSTTQTTVTTTAAPKELKIAYVGMITGPGSESEVRKILGAQAAADYINSQGGIKVKGDTYLVKILSEDSKMTPEGGLAAFNKLIYEDKVKLIITDDLPFISATETDLAEKEGVLTLVGINTGMPNELNAQKPLTFAIQSLIVPIPDAVDYLVTSNPDAKTVAIASPQAPDALNFQALQKVELERRGLKVVSVENFQEGTADFYPMLTKMLAAKPDIVGGGPGFWSWWASILKQARELGFKGPMFMGCVGGDPTALRDAVGNKEAADNFFIASFDINSPLMPPMISQTIANAMKAKGQDLLMEHADGWEPVWLLKQGIETAQSIDPVQVTKAFETMSTIETPEGTGHWGGLKTFGIKHVLCRPMGITRLVKGEVEMVKWFTPDAP